MFDTLEEAQELNSECSFCGLTKFSIETVFSLGKVSHNLIRCSDPDCYTHCKWDHKGVTIEMRIADRDSVELISGR